MTQIAVCIIVVSISCLCGVTEATVPSGAARLESFEGVHMSNIPEDIKRRIPQLDQVIGHDVGIAKDGLCDLGSHIHFDHALPR